MWGPGVCPGSWFVPLNHCHHPPSCAFGTNVKQDGGSGSCKPGLSSKLSSWSSVGTEIFARNHSVLQAGQPGASEEGQWQQ